jgi:hypothetical protein
MSPEKEAYFRKIPTKPYDLIKEGLIVLAILTAIVLILAGVLSSPDYPTLRAQDVAEKQPVAYLSTCANILAGNISIQDYGPPYNSDTGNAQRIAGIAPADWFGVTIPLDPPQDFIIKPLERASLIDDTLILLLSEFKQATTEQQQAWLTNYMSGLEEATMAGSVVQIPVGEYGPVYLLMDAMLRIGKAGLLEGALESSARLPFELDFTRSLLFFQDDVYAGVADSLDMLGDQWGVSNETGNYPGAWWTWPYAFLYQIPPMSTSDNADIQAIAIITGAFMILFFWPFIPGLRKLPKFLLVNRLIWRDWYTRQKRLNLD